MYRPVASLLQHTARMKVTYIISLHSCDAWSRSHA